MSEDVSRMLSAIEHGDRQATADLLPLVYDELRILAAQKMAQERPGQTLDATALVHEAYVRLVNVPEPQGWAGRRHFYAAAGEAMRRILVENARRKNRLKHGGGLQRVDAAEVPGPDEDSRLIALDDALTRLAIEDKLAAQVVELHHFAGLNHDHVARSLGISVYEARQKWIYAQAWLRDALTG